MKKEDILCGSDTTSGVASHILKEICKSANKIDYSYGNDYYTKKSYEKFQEIFNKKDIVIIPMLTGTASNALALSLLTKKKHDIICHKDAHILNSECDAPKFYSSDSNLIGLDGKNGQLNSNTINEYLKQNRILGNRKISGVSISQLTENGTAYDLQSLKEIGKVCKKHKIFFHMDGARFSNALSFLKLKPREITWEIGLDCLSLGATKNGAYAAEAIVFFNSKKVNNWEYFHKRSGNVIPKTKLISCQFISWFENDLWLQLAKKSNNAAKILGKHFFKNSNFKVMYPIEGNEIFVKVKNTYYKKILEKKIFPKLWNNCDNDNVVLRFVLGFDTKKKIINEMIKRLDSI